ncbi:MAG TPA: M20 family metallopeptidase [Thermoanaerobaculia bacterium]|nr:M20 family metallopeptidase [Thermoanaerobaculia bacterium]
MNPDSPSARRAGASWSPEALLAAAREALPWMVEIRRDLHQHPELGLEEHRTAARVQALLDELGIEHRDAVAVTGVVGTVRGAAPGPVVALRADLDALPLQDGKQHAPYRSRVPGRMHACGHDLHTAVLLGAARLLAARAGELTGTVKLLFQPAEETVGGARMMVEEGALEDPAVDAVFGLHADPSLPVGCVAVRYGQRNAASDDLRIVVHGRSSHGAVPSAGVDAIVVAAQVVTALQTVVARSVDPRDSAVVTLGTIRGGTQANILAREVELVGTVRTLDPAVRAQVLERVRATTEGVAAALGARAEVELRPAYDPVINHDAMIDVVRGSAERLLGAGKVAVQPRPSLGVEDFGHFLTRTPGAFWSLGVRNEARGIVHPLHHELFDVDEEAMAVGAAVQVGNVLTVLGGAAGAGDGDRPRDHAGPC